VKEHEPARGEGSPGVRPGTGDGGGPGGVDDVEHDGSWAGALGLVQRLLDAGHAYVGESGNVYYDVRSLPGYGSLTNQRLEDLATTEDESQLDDDVEADKRDPRDFALWKASKPTEPADAAWDAPWGRGRPGWHLECSTMSRRYLGETFDIHGGGIDLRFPHHENEQAQSHGAGWGFARHWVHNAWVTIKGEKMSKSMYNVVNPDMIVERYGADTLRLYEMFLGPLEQSKPWDTNGIDGVHRFLRKLWGLYYSTDGLRVTDTPATKEELKSLHKLIRKVTQDVEQFSFNTSVAAFMICINELQGLKTASREVLQPLLILLAPFAPHIAEELWHAIGEETTIVAAQWPEYDEKLLVEDSFKYPVSFNGKTRFTIELPREASQDEIREAVLSADEAQKWLEGKTPKKVIIVPGRIINIVL